MEASAPKKKLRMSLSMPTTAKPCRARNPAVSAPISPPEPVTIAVGAAAALLVDWLSSTGYVGYGDVWVYRLAGIDER